MKKIFAVITLWISFGPAAILADSDSGSHASSASEQFSALLDQAMEQQLEFHPQLRAYLGMNEDNDRWNDYSVAFSKKEHKRTRAFRKKLAKIDFEALSPAQKSQYEVVRYSVDSEIGSYQWRYHGYSISQQSSPIDNLTSFLINFHAIETTADAEAFITRVNGIPGVVNDILDWARREARKGVRPPSFAYPKVIENTRALLKGQPFDQSDTDSTLLATFKTKLAAVDAADEEKTRLTRRLSAALEQAYEPTLRDFIVTLGEWQEKTNEDAGVWKLPRGESYYQHRLAASTTTNLSAEEIHQTGLAEVARIHGELRALMKPLGFEGTLPDFLTYMRVDPKWYFPESDEGREQYLNATREAIDRIRPLVKDYFSLQPKADLVVKRVEPFREKNMSAAFYNSPSLDGSRPGIYYVPLYRMEDNARWDMISTAYHEAIPGHHMQIAIAQELTDTPLLLKLSFFGAYVEGWALYAEQLAYEMGLYKDDPVGNFGRLSSELFRAVRLVVDTGIHQKRWTRTQAIDYMVMNTPLTETYVTGEIERYIAWPAQATSYKVGMMKILQLRAWSKQQLGNDFDIRSFHDVVLSSGQLPLSVLETKIQDWVKSLQL